MPGCCAVDYNGKRGILTILPFFYGGINNVTDVTKLIPRCEAILFDILLAKDLAGEIRTLDILM